jgi:hypothetical protein
MQLAERLEDRALGGEVEVSVLREQALEHQLVRGGAAQSDVGVAMAHDLVVRAIVLRGEARVSERRQRIGCDGDGVALADDDERSHDGNEAGI